MKAIPWITFSCLILFLGCGKKKSPPSFAVRPLEGTAVRSLSSITSAATQNLAAEISCTAELEYSNASPQTVGRMNVRTAEEYLEHAYAWALFYDCNARQQALEDGDGELRSDSDLQAILQTKGNPEDHTRFVAWMGDLNAQESQGKLVNLYLQDDRTRTKTRIDLNKVGGLKTVDVVFHFQWNNGVDHWSRAYFREISESEQFVVQRHYDSDDDTVIIVAGHFLEEVGSATFRRDCLANGNPNIACDLDTTSNTAANYLQDDGTTNFADANAADTAGLTIQANISGLIDEVANLDRFYTGTEDQFFTPTFNP